MDEPVLIAHIPSNPKLIEYCTYLGVGHSMTISGVVHVHDGYSDVCKFKVKSVELGDYPKPHTIRGVLYLDVNRPGTDAGSDHVPSEVVIELHSYPRTRVFLANGYRLSGRIVKRGEEYQPQVAGFDYGGPDLGLHGCKVTEAELPSVIARMAEILGVPESEVEVVDAGE